MALLEYEVCFGKCLVYIADRMRQMGDDILISFVDTRRTRRHRLLNGSDDGKLFVFHLHGIDAVRRCILTCGDDDGHLLPGEGSLGREKDLGRNPEMVDIWILERSCTD